jgi:hypothetical protein
MHFPVARDQPDARHAHEFYRIMFGAVLSEGEETMANAEAASRIIPPSIFANPPEAASASARSRF